MTIVEQALATAQCQEWAAVLAATVRVARDLDVAEECVQDAYVSALDSWTRTGIPARPGAWLTVAARRNAVDRLRRSRSFHGKMHLLVEPDVTEESLPIDPVIHDDRLRLIFMCCHPSLAREAQVALTPRFVCGLSTGDVANVFLTSEATMAARITRAKKKIAGAHIPFRIPADAELPDRLDAVLTVVHLLFTTGHTAPSGETLTRDDLAGRGGPCPPAERPDSGRAGNPGSAGVAGAESCPALHPHGDGRALALARRPRSFRLGPSRHRGGEPDGRRGVSVRQPWPIHAASVHRGGARHRPELRGDRLGFDRGGLRPAAGGVAVASRRAESGDGAEHGSWARGGARGNRTPARR